MKKEKTISILAAVALVAFVGYVWAVPTREYPDADILAAAALHALDHHRDRLADDHAHARALADGLARLEQTITADSLDSLPSPIGEESRLLDVMLPRFEATTTFQLEETLPEMGMPLAFDSVKADFSGVNGGKQRLWIGRAIHKAFVRVNEEGTEAAAATLIELGLGGLGPKGTPIPFHADHPFLFLIRHRETGVILFMGRVTDPSRPGA